MTGPVERVPLTDERLQRLVDRLRASTRQGLPAPDAADELVAELRASRAREQELQQRIDKAVGACDTREIHAFRGGTLYVQSCLIRAILTGTET